MDICGFGLLLPSEKNLDAKGLCEGQTSGLCFIGGLRFDVHRVFGVNFRQSKVIRLTRWLGFFDGRSGQFLCFFGTGMCFKCLFFGGR